MQSLDLMTPDARLGTVDAAGEMDDSIRGFLEGLTVQGGLRPGQPGYLDALYELLRGGTYLWAQAADSSDGRGI